MYKLKSLSGRLIGLVLFLCVVGMALVFPLIAEAQQFNFMDQFTLTQGGTGTVQGEFGDLGTLVNRIVQPVMVAVGVIFLIIFVYNGFMLATKSGEPQAIDQARKMMTAGLIGLLIVFSAFWITEIILIATIGDTAILGL
ncbi:MAG: hypothetical protein LBG64_02045 [Pseudomonadales bacterium]|nr:hypothetical protein [Pseudomonadales bacterium]